MAFYISKVIFHNRAPFEHLELDFSEKDIVILNAVNGGGKTTILSHIVDAWYEMVRLGFANEFEGKAGKYYRVSASIHSLDEQICSLFYVRFIKDDQYYDYMDIRGNCDSSEYDKIVEIENKIVYSEFSKELTEGKHTKIFSRSKMDEIENIFVNNVITYFPAYRYEEPGYLNDPFKINTNFSLKSPFRGYLKNPIEIITGLPELANWLMDILLDLQLNQPTLNGLLEKLKTDAEQLSASIFVPSTIYNQINRIITNVLSIKSNSKLSIGVGNRNQGAMRIQVGERDVGGNWIRTVYPSIFNMSSGETAVVTMFGEILRQFDNIKPNDLFINATGIVLIDEIDKHLHIKLQKDILPQMFNLFPNIQFIISSHSPFVSMGLFDEETTKQRTKIIDLDKGGIEVGSSSTEVFREAYEAMISENERFHQLFIELQSKQKSEKLVLVSEGNNGKHIHKALNILAPELLEKLEFSFSDKTGWQQLKNAYDAMYNSKQAKYLFVFDCDCPDSVRQLKETENFFVLTFEERTDDCRVKKGLENLYPAEVITDDIYITHEEVDAYGAKKDIQTFDKNKLIDRIETDTNIAHFEYFKPLIEKIRTILQLTNEATPNEQA